ncbi:MAG: nicotinate-nucleotide adenylyltransferase [Hyphomonadaceae bacterium]
MYRLPHAPSTGRFRRKEQAYPGMRIGLFGGSFNPAHEGHAHVAETALARLNLDRVWWLVTPQNPLKSSAETAPLAQRMASARAFANGPRMVVSDVESRWRTQFSIDLLRKLKKRYPGVHFVWLLGSDNLSNFHRWRRWEEIARLAPIAFVARPGHLARARFAKMARRFAAARRDRLPANARPPAWTWIAAPLDAHSSTALRRRARTARKV